MMKLTLKDISWENFISANKTFAVRVKRSGTHDFSSLEIARLAGDIIIKRVASRANIRPKVNLRNPDMRILIDIFQKDMLVGIDTTGPSLHMRRYREADHPLAIKTTIAYLMIKLSNWKQYETIINPMCGGGTIPIEAAIHCKNIPLFTLRGDDFAFYKLVFLPLYKINIIKQKIMKNVRINKKCPILAFDREQKYIKMAIKNASNASVLDTIKFNVRDFLNLTYEELIGLLVILLTFVQMLRIFMKK